MNRDFEGIVEKDGEFVSLEFTVKDPDIKDQNEATKVYNRAFRDALESGAILRASLDDYMTKQGLWSEEKQALFDEINKKIVDSNLALQRGGIKLSEARDIALNMTVERNKLKELIANRTALDGNTAEGQADNERFNYLVSRCTVYKDSNKPYFKDFAAFKMGSSSLIALQGARILANLIYGLEDNFEKTLPENEFLLKFGLVDENLRLINKDGDFVDRDGNRVDADGFLVDEEGNYVDEDGNKISIDGSYDVEFSPFLDEDGSPIVEDGEEEAVAEEEPAPKPKPRAKRTAKKTTTARKTAAKKTAAKPAE
jgi:hypothetical protein